MRATSRPCLVLLGVLAWALPAGAQQSPESPAYAEARASFQAGIAAAAGGRWDEAVGNLERARTLRPTPAVWLNLALAYRAVHRPHDAVQSIDAFLAAPGTVDPARLAQAQALRAELAPTVAWVELVGLEPGVTVLFDGRPYRGPARVLTQPGSHTVQAQREGYVSRELALALGPGQSLRATLTLTRDATLGQLQLEVLAEGATVRLDGRLLEGRTWRGSLSSGTHQLTVRAAGYQALSRTVVITAGQTLELPVRLERERPLVASPWLWLGVGLGAAAIGTGIGLGTAAATRTPVYSGELGTFSQALRIPVH